MLKNRRNQNRFVGFFRSPDDRLCVVVPEKEMARIQEEKDRMTEEFMSEKLSSSIEATCNDPIIVRLDEQTIESLSREICDGLFFLLEEEKRTRGERKRSWFSWFLQSLWG